MALHPLNHAEHATDRLVQARHADSHVVPVLLDHLNLIESLAHLLHAGEQVAVTVHLAQFIVLIVVLLSVLMHDLVDLGVKVSDVDSTVGHEALLYTLKLFVLESANLELNDEASTELILDVLGATEALKNAALHKDAHLG